MNKLLKTILDDLKTVIPESYFDKNTNDTVSYPYVTIDLSGETIERNIEGFYIDVDIFDHSSSYIGVMTVEEAIKDHFKDKQIMTEDHFIRFAVRNSLTINTGDESIKRRNIQVYAKTDWRKK